MSLSEALMTVSKLISTYPNGGGQAGKGYMGALAAVLASYPTRIAIAVADPVYGVPRECKFLPTPADVIAWCERELAEMRRPVDHLDRLEKLREEAKQRESADAEWQKARMLRLPLDALRAKHGPNWGIKDLLAPSKRQVPWDKQAPEWADIRISDELTQMILPAVIQSDDFTR
jgi:hypothetical protein